MTSISIAEEELGLSEKTVANYLRANPDFFERHEALLLNMRLRHDGRGAISLVEHQLTLLRNKNESLESKLLELVRLARENETLSIRLHRLAQVLIEAENVDDVLATVRDHLINEFKAEMVTVSLFDDVATAEKFVTGFERPFESRRPYSGTLKLEEAELLFGENAAEVASAAVIPLFDEEPLGFLALGSQSDTRFYPGMGMLFLGNLSELVACAILHHRRMAEQQ